MQSFVEGEIVQKRLHCRDALFGGRTNAVKLYRDVSDEPNLRIGYADVTSLYPTVLKYDPFPVGIPDIIMNPPSTDISDYFGVIHCTVRPPRGLYHPVLPMRGSDGKLLFALCQTCTSRDEARSCQCSDEERDMQGTWCSVELHAAVEHGYIIVAIHEVYNFVERRTDIFSGYINLFLKRKQESSGFPCSNMTAEDKLNYIRDYELAEGISLDLDAIGHNIGMRTSMKSLLNNLWGKFTERQHRRRHVLVNDTADFFKYLTDESIDVADFHVLAPNTLQVEYDVLAEYVRESPHVNIFVGIFTTAHARMRLFTQLHRLGTSAMYYDTDSVLYEYDHTSSHAVHPPYGRYLGDWTDELDEDDYVIEFCSSGPKSYSYRTFKGRVVAKIKGFTLHYDASLSLNFDSLKQLVLHYADPAVYPLPSVADPDSNSISIHYPNKITRDRFRFLLYGRDITKRFQVTYGKRLLLRDGSFDTVPFGY